MQENVLEQLSDAIKARLEAGDMPPESVGIMVAPYPSKALNRLLADAEAGAALRNGRFKCACCWGDHGGRVVCKDCLAKMEINALDAEKEGEHVG